MTHISSNIKNCLYFKIFTQFLDSPFCVKWRGVRDLNPRGPMDHRLSRPAPYQARRTPLKILCSARNLKKVSVPPKPSFYKTVAFHTVGRQGRLSSWLGCSPYAAEVAGSNPVRPTTETFQESFIQEQNLLEGCELSEYM